MKADKSQVLSAIFSVFGENVNGKDRPGPSGGSQRQVKPRKHCDSAWTASQIQGAYAVVETVALDNEINRRLRVWSTEIVIIRCRAGERRGDERGWHSSLHHNILAGISECAHGGLQLSTEKPKFKPTHYNVAS